jgi:hypothetical protein
MNEKKYEIKVEMEFESLPFVRLNPCRARLVAFLPAENGRLVQELEGVGCWGFSHFIDLLSSTSDGKFVTVSYSVEAENWNELDERVSNSVYELSKTLVENKRKNRELMGTTPSPRSLSFFV